MTENSRLSEVDGGPFAETDLILYNHFKAASETYANEVAIISCHQRPDSSPLSLDGTVESTDCLRWTFRELWERSERLAKALLAHRIPRDRRLVVFLRNQAEWPLALWASLMLGISFVAMHPVLTDSPVELEHELAMVNVGTILAADDATAAALQKLVPHLMEDVSLKIVLSEDGLAGLWIPLRRILDADVSSENLPAVNRSPDDITTFYFTSGTTSLPKGAPCKSSNTVRAMTGYANSWRIDHSRRMAGHSPSFHSYTGTAWFGFWLRGGSVVFPSPTYSPGATLEAIEKEKCTDMMGNPSMIDSLINYSTAAERDLSSLFHVNLSGSMVHPEHLKKCSRPPLNAAVVGSSFGTTETATLCNWDIQAIQPAYRDAVSVGKVVPGAKARICYPDTHEIVPWGETGELHIGGSLIYSGWPGRDESSFYREGDITWVVTGDQARFGSEEELYILGRYKDLIIRGGRNISPAAIEAVLNILPGVSSVVVGLPDEIAGEVPAVVVKFATGHRYTDKEIRSTVARSLGQYATPARVMSLTDLGLIDFPLSAAQKLDRKRVAAVVEEFFEEGRKTERKSINGAGTSSTCVALAGIWADLTLQSTEEIDINRPVTEFADSLMILQVISLVRKRLKRSITAEKFFSHPTIRQQAEILDRQAHDVRKDRCGLQARPTGPPSAADIANVGYNDEAFEKTKTVVEQALCQYRLSWSDVEEIMPCYDNVRFMLNSAQRLQSWNDRHVFVAEGDAQRVQVALCQSLENHPLFRSMAVEYDTEMWLHVALRSTPESMKHVVDIVEDAISEDQLLRYRLNDPDFDHANRDGFAFRATVVPMDNGRSSGIVINMNHSAYDAISTSMWLDDLTLCLAADASQRLDRISCKLFADAHYFGRSGSAAQRSTRFFVKNLLWYVTEQKAWWPKQRQRGWFMGDPIGWRSEDGDPLDGCVRPSLDAVDETYGQIGFTTEVEIADKLQSLYGVSAAALFKAAVAIFNVRQTGAKFAIFSNWEAGRTFPFLEDNVAYTSMLPNAMDIAGPTAQRVVNRVPFSPKQTVKELLSEVQAGITEISKHAHAPLYEIRDKLAEVSSTEADAFMDALHRQIFNWVPNIRAGSLVDSRSGASGDKPVLRRIHRIARGDCGFAWTGCRLSKNKCSFSVWWDDAQLSWREARSALAEVVACVKWMMVPENMHMPLSQWLKTSWKDLLKEAEAAIVLADIS